MNLYQVTVSESITSLVAQQFPVGRQFFSVAGLFDDDLVAGVGQAVQGAVAQDGVFEEAEPFLHRQVAGDDEAGDPVSADDQLVEVGGLLGGEPVQAQVVQDEQVRGQEGAEGPVTELSTRAWVMALKKSSA